MVLVPIERNCFLIESDCNHRIYFRDFGFSLMPGEIRKVQIGVNISEEEFSKAVYKGLVKIHPLEEELSCILFQLI